MDGNSKTITKTGNIKVIIHIPEKVNDNIRQIKINRIYDILKPHDKK